VILQPEPEVGKGGGGGGARAAARFAAGKQAGPDWAAPRAGGPSVFGAPVRRGWVADTDGGLLLAPTVW
jgi:hypothetical protein